MIVVTTYLEHNNTSLSRILPSREIADIIKHVVKESTNPVHPNHDDEKKEISRRQDGN